MKSLSFRKDLVGGKEPYFLHGQKLQEELKDFR